MGRSDGPDEMEELSERLRQLRVLAPRRTPSPPRRSREEMYRNNELRRRERIRRDRIRRNRQRRLEENGNDMELSRDEVEAMRNFRRLRRESGARRSLRSALARAESADGSPPRSPVRSSGGMGLSIRTPQRSSVAREVPAAPRPSRRRRSESENDSPNSRRSAPPAKRQRNRELSLIHLRY